MNKLSICSIFVMMALALVLENCQVVHAADILNVFHDARLIDITRDQAVPLDGIPDIIDDTLLVVGKTSYFSFYRNETLYSLWEFRSVMTFDISPYAGKTLSSAIWTGFGLNDDIAGYPPPIVGKFFLSSGDGLVTTSDFNTPAVFVGKAEFPSWIPPNDDYKPIQLDMTAALQNLITLGSHYAELRVESDLNWADFPQFKRNNQPVQFDQWGYNMIIEAGEAAPGEYFNPKWPGPQLAVTTTPEPVSAVLFLLGGGTMFYRRFQKRK